MTNSKMNIGAKISLDGEKEYRQAIGNVGKSMAVLKSELKAVSAEFQGNANSLDALKSKNDILSKQQTEQEKKLKLLRGALEDATKEYGENSKKAQDWQIKLNNAYAELKKINRELDENEKYMKEAEKSTDKTAKSIDEFGKKVKETKEETLDFGDVLKANLASEAIVEGVKALFNAIKDGSKAMVDIVKDTAAYADNILTLSTQTGIATGTLQELNYMAELTDTSLETVTNTMARNIRSMNSASNGTKLYVDTYRQLGVQITDTNGQLKSSETVYWDVLDALGKMANETERDSIAMQLFGRSAQDLNPLIAVGKDGMAEFAREARLMGAVLSEDVLSGLGETDDALQRLYQQIDITKRKFGIEMAPAMTESFEKLADKMNDVDDEFADFAGGALNSVVDGFIWMIDNIDIITAGLKGMAAAFITKKAADGITYAIKAYKTLTTATEAATAAQTAFNTASKANAIGAIVSVVIGLGTALYSYAKSSSDAAEETRKLTDETEQLLESSRKLNEEARQGIESRKEAKEQIISESEATKRLAQSLYDLAEKENKSSGEKAQMLVLVEELNKAVPNLNLSIDSQTGALNRQEGQVLNLIEAELRLQRVKLAGENLAKNEYDKYTSEQKLADLKKQEEEAKIEMTAAYDEYLKARDSFQIFYIYKSKSKIDDVRKQHDGLKDEINATKEAIAGFDKELQDNYAYLALYGDEYAESVVTSNKAIVDNTKATTEKYVKYVEKAYKESSDALEERLKREQKALSKAQKAQTQAVQDASDEELKILEKQTEKELKLINARYMKKMQLVDEERYKELKVIQDEIDGINNQTEAENRATKLREEAEERIALQTKITTAETTEERIKAQEELAKFEQKVARERLLSERTLQVEVLKEKQDTINKAYDAEIDSLKVYQKVEEDKVNETFRLEKESIKKRLELKLEELADVQEIERDNLAKSQGEYRQYLDDQKTLAVENAKNITKEELNEQKLRNALMYNEEEEQRKKIKELYQTYGPDLNPATKFYIPTNTKNQNLSTNFDSSAIEHAVKAGVSAAMRNVSFTAKFKDKSFFELVSESINNMIR